MNETKNPWQIKGQKEIYDNRWIRVTEYDVINPSGGKGIYGKIHFKNTAIGIVVLDDELNTFLVGQYRFALDEYTWEIPEGGSPVGSDPLLSAKRELLEETGLVAERWQQILTMQLSNSVTDEISLVYLARELTQKKPCPEETEQLTVRKLPFEELWHLVNDGKITDAITVAATQKIKLMMLNGSL